MWVFRIASQVSRAKRFELRPFFERSSDGVELLPFVDGEEDEEEEGDEEEDRMTPDGDTNFKEFQPDMAS